MIKKTGDSQTGFTPPSYAVCALLSLLFFVVLLSAGITTFQTNDDTNCIAFVTGQFTGTPDYHLIFSHVIIGNILVWLYGLTTTVNWYTWFLLSTHFVALTTIVYSVTRPVKEWLSFLFFLLFLWLLYTPFIITLTFTTTAFAACLSGFLLFSADMLTNRVVSTANRLLGGLMIVLGAMIRVDSMLLLGALLTPIIIFEWVSARRIILWKQYSLLALVCGGVLLIDFFAYRTPEWQYYLQYNKLRAQIHDVPYRVAAEDKLDDLPALRQAMAENGWSKNDLWMLLRGYISDDTLFSYQKLSRFTEATPVGLKTLKESVKLLLSSGEGKLEILALPVLGAIVLLLLGYRTKQMQNKLPVLVLLLSVIFLCVGLLISKKLPLRVSLPIFFFLNIMIILRYVAYQSVGAMVRRLFTGYGKYITPAFLVGLFVIGGWIGMKYKDRIIKKLRQADSNVAIFASLCSLTNNRFIIESATVPFEKISIFQVHKENVGDKFIVTGCLIGSPLMNTHQSRAGIKDIYSDLVDSADLLLIARDEELLPHYLLYLKEHFQVNAEADLVMNLQTLFVYRIRSVINKEDVSVQNSISDCASSASFTRRREPRIIQDSVKKNNWISAFAGMTGRSGMTGSSGMTGGKAYQ